MSSEVSCSTAIGRVRQYIDNIITRVSSVLISFKCSILNLNLVFYLTLKRLCSSFSSSSVFIRPLSLSLLLLSSGSRVSRTTRLG